MDAQGYMYRKENRVRVSRKDATAIFAANSDVRKWMDEDGFLLSLDDIAENYFDEDYDNFYNTNVASSKLEVKRDMLYDLIGWHDPK